MTAPLALARVQGVEIAVYSDDGPTRERLRHGEFALVDIVMEADEGRKKELRRVSKAVDTLMLMERAGTITSDQRQAAERFQQDFGLAGLDALRAFDLTQPTGEGLGEISSSMLDARNRVWRVMEQLGGVGTPIGAAAWWVVGYGLTVAEFARRERWGRRGHMDRRTAAGLVVGALNVMAASRERLTIATKR